MQIGQSFAHLLPLMYRYLVMVGSRGSGKTEMAARKVYIRCRHEGNHRFLILRKVRKTLKDSCIKVMTTLLQDEGFRLTQGPTPGQRQYTYNQTDRKIKFLSEQGHINELLFEGMDDPEKLKSIKGITSEWMEEPTEFTKDDFTQADLVLREDTGHYHQVILSFNPDEARAPWLKKMFFTSDEPKTGPGKRRDSYIHHSTYEDNPDPFVRREYAKILNDLDDPTYRRIYKEGFWAIAKGLIYNWGDAIPLPNIPFDEVIMGGDFGFSINPAALVKIYRKGLEFWVEEILYSTGLTTPQMGEVMRQDMRIDPMATSYWDAEDPKAIQELKDLGFNVYPSEKGPGSVKVGIDLLKSLKIHIIEGSENLIKEHNRYKWKEDKDNRPLPVPVPMDDHLLSAIRYAIFTHYQKYLRKTMAKKGKAYTGKEEKVKTMLDEEVKKEEVDVEKKPPTVAEAFELVRKRIGEVFAEDGKVVSGDIARDTEAEEITVRNALVSMGFVENEPGVFDRSPDVKDVQLGRRKGKAHF